MTAAPRQLELAIGPRGSWSRRRRLLHASQTHSSSIDPREHVRRIEQALDTLTALPTRRRTR